MILWLQGVVDGFDVLSLFLGPLITLIGNVTYTKAIALACLGALKAGLLCVHAATNIGWGTSIVTSFNPWITFVDATTTDRAYPRFLYTRDGKNYSSQRLIHKCITKLVFCQYLFQSFNMNLACIQ